MEKDPQLAWPKLFSFAPPRNGRVDPDAYFLPGVVAYGKTSDSDEIVSASARMVVLAFMIVAAYNGGEQFLSRDDAKHRSPNSWNHGQNGAIIAEQVWQMGLFK